MEALGLAQHIDKPTHYQGNTLDHIYTESLDQLGILHTFIGQYISDYRIVGVEIDMKKRDKQLEPKPRHPLHELNLESFSKEFNNETNVTRPNMESI